ncbi:WD40-repeat-containing domain protein [Auriculariales sp. MPI-PUGE-AT-0066]|nr:WD40-repeat-containing domain protein [Auriculariales sp. MPI-PUGE-AT-0066]
MYPIKSVRFSRSGKFLATAHLDGKVAIWNVHARGLQHVFAPHQMPCLDVDWYEDALVASCNDMQIALLAVEPSHTVSSWKAHDSFINQVRYNTKNQLLASCSDDGSCKVWNMPKLENDGRPSESSAEHLLFANLVGHIERVTCVAWSPTEVMQLATCGFDSTARIWNASTKQCLQIVSGHSRTCLGIAFSLDGGLLASASDDGTIIVTSASDGQRLVEWHEQDRQPACNLAFTVVDGQPYVCAGIQRRAVILRPHTGTG